MTTKIGDIWEQPRSRKAITWISVVVLVVGLGALLISQNRVYHPHYNSTPNSSPFAKDGAKIAVPAAAIATTNQFVKDTVLRKNLPQAWDITTTSLRGDLTHKQWNSGTIPVQPFSPGTVFTRVKTVESRQKRVWFEMLASHVSDGDPAGGLYYIQLIPRDGKWVVSYWGPKGWNPPVPASGSS